VDIVLSPESGKPIYEQIRGKFAVQILDGELAASYKLLHISLEEFIELARREYVP
jgi:DNA-binding transcriptional regulator YhcF (GntR family)